MSKLAQADDVVFERNIAIIASKKKEVIVYSGSFIYEGFLSGLDDQWLQIYGHEEEMKSDPDSRWRFILLNKDTVSGIGCTGRTTLDIDEKTRGFIEQKIQTFVGVATNFS